MNTSVLFYLVEKFSGILRFPYRWKPKGQYYIISLLMSRTIEKKRAKVSTFLMTLRQMLNKNQPPQYITWYDKQNQFKIKNPSRFSEEVLPKYFKHSNLSSFVRQLNIYDFKKMSNQKYPDEYIYSHPYFDKNRPELMNKIYRKVHHLPSKTHKPSYQQSSLSQNSQENSSSQLRKRLKKQVDKLEKKLGQLESINSMICEENMELQAKLPINQIMQAQSSKQLYKILMKSYEVQYVRFAEKINNQLIEQSNLLNEVYERQKNQKNNLLISFETNSKIYSTKNKKFDQNKYNSTSSGGSLNGHQQKQKKPAINGLETKQALKIYSKNQSLFKEQDKNSIKSRDFKSFQNLNVSYKIKGATQTYFKGKIEMFDELYDPKKLIQKENDSIKKTNLQEQHSFSEHLTEQHPNLCVIDLKNKRDEEHKDISQMYKAIVLNPNQSGEKIISCSQVLKST